jgi:hypothetical protein
MSSDYFDEERYIRTYGPFYVWRQYKRCSVDDAIQRKVLKEIVPQFIALMEEAIVSKDLPQILRLWGRAEQVLNRYASEQFHRLIPFQVDIQRTIWTLQRMLRRRLIREILTAPTELEARMLLRVLERSIDIDLEEDCEVVRRTMNGPKGAMFADLIADLELPIIIPPIATRFPATQQPKPKRPH